MIRKLALTVAAFAAIAAPAAAQDVYSIRVNLIGKDRAAIEAEVRQAATAVCRQANRDVTMAELRACAYQAKSQAMAQIAGREQI